MFNFDENKFIHKLSLIYYQIYTKLKIKNKIMYVKYLTKYGLKMPK